MLGSERTQASAVNEMHGYRLLFPYSDLRVIAAATRKIVAEIVPARPVST